MVSSNKFRMCGQRRTIYDLMNINTFEVNLDPRDLKLKRQMPGSFSPKQAPLNK